MLAKVWKKVLLAICIVACIFNIMTKLVNKSSLENNLKNVDGESIFSILEQKEEEKKSDVIDGVVAEPKSEDSNSNAKVTNENIENNESDYVVIY